MAIEKRKNFLINLGYYGFITLAAVVLLKYILPMIAPFAVAFVIASLLQGPIRFFRKRLHLPHEAAAVLAVLLAYGLISGGLSLLGIRAVGGLMDLIRLVPNLYYTHVLPFFSDILQNLEAVFIRMDADLVAVLDNLGNELIVTLGQKMSELSVVAMSFVTDVASSIPGLFIRLVLMVISTFFIAIDYERLTGFCLRQLSGSYRNLFFQIKEYVAGTLLVCLRSYIIIMSITFVELSIAFSIIGLQHAMLVAFCISIFDILPVLGTGGVMGPWAVLALLQGNLPLAIKLLLIYLIITVIRNIIEPKIVGGQLGLHPVVTLCSMFLGLQLVGGVGVFGFPIGLSLLRYLNDHGVIKIFKDEEPEDAAE